MESHFHNHFYLARDGITTKLTLSTIWRLFWQKQYVNRYCKIFGKFLLEKNLQDCSPWCERCYLSYLNTQYNRKLSKLFIFFPMPRSNIFCLATICPTWRPQSLIEGVAVGPWILIGGAVAATMILIEGAVVETRFLIGGFVPGTAPRATCYSLNIIISGCNFSPSYV